MFIELPFYVSAVKMRFRYRKEIGLWYLANVRDSLSLNQEIYFYLVKKEKNPPVGGIYVPVKAGLGQGEIMGFKMQPLWFCSAAHSCERVKSASC